MGASPLPMLTQGAIKVEEREGRSPSQLSLPPVPARRSRAGTGGRKILGEAKPPQTPPEENFAHALLRILLECPKIPRCDIIYADNSAILGMPRTRIRTIASRVMHLYR